MRFLTHLLFTGTQYVITAVCPTSNTRLVLDAELTSAALGALFGVRSGYRTDAFSLFTSEHYLQDEYGTASGNIPVSALGRHRFEKQQNVLCLDGVPIHETPVQEFACPYPLTLLAIHTGSGIMTGYPVSGMLYSASLYDGDTLVQDLIPALNDEDIPGLYDKCTGSFYPSASAEPFLPGALLQRTFTVTFPTPTAGTYHARVYPISREGSLQAEITQSE